MHTDARRARRDAFFRNAFFRNAFFRNVAHAFESDRRAQPDSRHRRCDVGETASLAATIDLECGEAMYALMLGFNFWFPE